MASFRKPMTSGLIPVEYLGRLRNFHEFIKGSSGYNDYSTGFGIRYQKVIYARQTVISFRINLSHGKCNYKSASFSYFTFNLNFSTVQYYNVLYNAKPETCTTELPRTCFISPVKSLKNSRQVIFGNSNSCIKNLDSKV